MMLKLWEKLTKPKWRTYRHKTVQLWQGMWQLNSLGYINYPHDDQNRWVPVKRHYIKIHAHHIQYEGWLNTTTGEFIYERSVEPAWCAQCYEKIGIVQNCEGLWFCNYCMHTP